MNKLILVAVISSLVTLVVAFSGFFIFGYYQNWELPLIGKKNSQEYIDEKDKELENVDINKAMSEYKNNKLGISFEYPNDFVIREKDGVIFVSTMFNDSLGNGKPISSDILFIDNKQTNLIIEEDNESKYPKTVNVLGKVLNVKYERVGGGNIEGVSVANLGYVNINENLSLLLSFTESSFSEVSKDGCKIYIEDQDYYNDCLELVGKKGLDYRISTDQINKLLKLIESIKIL